MRQYSGGRKRLEAPSGPGTVRELLRANAIPEVAAAAIIVNEEQRDLDTRVHDGDTVEILPAISGGGR